MKTMVGANKKLEATLAMAGHPNAFPCEPNATTVHWDLLQTFDVVQDTSLWRKRYHTWLIKDHIWRKRDYTWRKRDHAWRNSSSLNFNFGWVGRA